MFHKKNTLLRQTLHSLPPLLLALVLSLVMFGLVNASSPLARAAKTFSSAPQAVTITATKTDTLFIDVDGDTNADPGDTLQYSIVVANSGDTDGTNTIFTDVTDDTEVTVVAGSLRATPMGVNDIYNVIGNTHITHPLGTGLLANDVDPDGGALTASCAPCTTTNGGTVTLNGDGSFTYGPPASFVGNDTFTYTVTDNHGLTDTGTVTFNVTNRIWWVDSNAAGAGTGTSLDPFQALSSAQTASFINDIIFIYNRGASYTAGFVLKNGQRLCGHGTNLATCSGLTPPTGTTFPAASTNPTLINGAGHDVTLAQNNTIQGVTLGNTGAAANFALFGNNFGTLDLQLVTINTNNGAISLTTGTANATFTAVTATGGTNNVTLTTVNGTLNLGAGALSGSSSDAFVVNGGTAGISYTGTINNTTARAVNIQNKTGGTATFGGAITNTATGIVLTNNTGATITFSGGLSLNTGTNAAFSATGGGTLNVTGTNTATTSTGTAINIRNMIIGASGVTFRTVSANGGANGIYLENNTGTGSFTVSGTGSAGSGGTIQNMTGANATTSGIGVYINNNSAPVSLNYMQLNGFSNFAIRGITVGNFTLANSVISGISGDSAADDEGAVSFTNLSGTATITNNNISGGHEDNFKVINTTGTLNFTMSGTTIRDTPTVSPGNNGLILEANVTANITANITTSSFLRNRANGIQANTNGAGIMDITIGTNGVANSGGTFQDNNIGVNIAHNSSGTLNFDVQNGTFQPVALTTGASPININLAALGNQMSGNIRNNFIRNANSSTGPGMRIIGNGTGTLTILVDNNNIAQIGNRGIEVIARDGSNTINATITNNTVALTDPLSADGIRADAGAVSTDTTTICANINSNTSTTIAGVFGIRVRQRFVGTTYRLQGYGGAATDMAAVQSFLSTNNSGATTLADFAGGGYLGGVCPLPALAPVEVKASESAGAPAPTANTSANDGSALNPVEATGLQELLVEPLPVATLVPTIEAEAPVVDDTFATETTTAPRAPEATTTVGPFTMPFGEQTTITFQVVIQNPFPAAQNPICNQATISGSNFSNVLSDDPGVAGAANPTCTPVQINADLSITKTDGTATEIPGTAVTYTIVASNAGPNPDPAAVVADTFPATITGVTWSCVGAGGATCTAAGAGNINDTVNLPVGGSVTYTAVGTISAAATGTLANTATVATSTGITDPVPANNSATDTDTLTPQADVSITKTDGQATDIPGTSIVYTIVASNAGPSNAPGTTIADTFPATLTGVTWTCAGAGGGVCTAAGAGNINDTVNLPAGGSVTYTVNATIAASATGTLSNTATATTAGGVTDPTPGNNSATDTTTLTPQADVSITKTDGQVTDVPGTSIVYTIVASNAGPSNAPSVTVADTFPATLTGVTWTCVGAGGGTCTAAGAGNINDAVNLPAGGSVTYTVNATIDANASGTLSNTATATVGGGVTDPVPANNSATDTTTLTPQADLSITKTDGAATEIPGTSVTYTIVASNSGPSNDAAATVADTFPATLTGVTWTCVGAGGGTCTAAGVGNINDTVNLPAGGSVTYTASGTISAAATGTLVNTATVTSGITDPVPGNNSATDTDTLTPQADVAITKTDGQTTAVPGTPIVYTIVASNSGPSNAPGTTIADTFPATLTGVTWTCVGAGGGTCTAAGAGNLNDTANLPAGGSVTYTVNATISGSATGTLSNTATATTAGGVTDPNAGNNSATDTTTLTPQADLSITKTDGQTISVPGNPITYTIVASNAGPSNVTGATVADTFPASLTGMTWTCTGAGGGTCTAAGAGNINDTINLPAGASVTYVAVGTIDVGASGSIVNTATISSGVTDPVPGNNSATDTTTLDAPPVITSFTVTPGTINENGTVTATVTFTDPNTPETHEVVFAWGDGITTTVNLAIGVLTTSANHQYLDDNPTGTASDNYTVTVTVNEPDGGTDSDTATVTVNNTAPALSAVNATSVNENGTSTLTGTITDPGTQDTFSLVVNWGDGSAPQTFNYVAGTTNFSETHTYLDDNPTGTPSDNYTVSLTLTDDDTGNDTDSDTVTVTNVAPVLSGVAATNVNENGSTTLSGTITDPGTLDTFTLVVNWGDGSAPQTFNYAAGTTSFSETHQYLDDNPTGTPSDNVTVSLTLTDDDTGSDTDSATVTVSNVAPALSAVAATNVNENGSTTLTGTITDPGTLDTFTLVVNWGDGSAPQTFNYAAGTTSFSETHTYLDDNPTGTPSDNVTINLTLTDDDTGSDTDSDTITVSNVAPTLSGVTATANVNEGGSVTLAGTITDPGTLDTFSLVVDWGDGSAPQTFNYAAATTAFTETHIYQDDNPTGTPSDNVTISLTLTDDDTGSDTDSAAVTVNNVAPSLSAVAATSINENGSTTLSGTITDPGTLDTFSLVVDWGDGSAPQTFNYAAGTTSFSETHQYLDDNPTGTPSDSYTITLSLTDDDTGNDTDSATLTVSNVAPALGSLVISSPINEDDTATLTGTITDPGTLDTFSLVVNWGDGSAPQTFNYVAGTTTFTATHQYLDDNPTVTPSDAYTATLTLTDDDTGSDSDNVALTVNNVAPALNNVTATATITETEVVTLTGFIAEVGTQDTFTLTVAWGDGITDTFSYPAGTTAFVETHQYLDDGLLRQLLLANFDLDLTLSDDDSGVITQTVTVVVNNQAPTLSNVAFPSGVDEGDTATLTGNINEISPLDTFTLAVDWGDGITETFNYAAATTAFTETHIYQDDDPTATPSDSYTVTLILSDDNGGTDVLTTTITVDNVAPVLNSLAVTNVDENDAAALTANLVDPGTLDTFVVVVDWGDGITETFNYGAGTTTISETHVYLDDDPTGTPSDPYSVTVSIADDDTGTGTGAASLVVSNVAPTVDAGADQTVTFATPVNFAGSFTDPGTLDTHTVSWDMGDGTIITGTLTPSHLYQTAGTFTVTLTVTDDDTGVGTDTLQVIVGTPTDVTLVGVRGRASSFLPFILLALLVASGIAVILRRRSQTI